MKQEDKRTCSTCGTEFSAGAGFCPVCILRQAVDSKGDSIDSSLEDLANASLEPAHGLASHRFENYEILRREDGTLLELGRGAMGVTYKAIDVDLRCFVTLKVISERYLNDESARLRFVREARAAASLRHPNVASVFHLGKSGDKYFYAMEFVEGETLEHLIARSGRLKVKPALDIATQVAAGLVAVHKQNLVHRDIKPTNLMVSQADGGGQVAKIIDLGLAKVLDESPVDGALSLPGAFAGTPEFASPEQFGGIGVDIRSDLYSLGVTLWEMLTGHTPFRGSPIDVMGQHQHAPLPLDQLEGVPQPIVVLLEMLLEKDPALRFQSPGSLLKVMPVVTNAIDTGRPVTRQSLWTIAETSLDPCGKARGLWPVVQSLGSSWGLRRLLLTLIVLVAGAGMTLVAIAFFRASHSGADGSSGTSRRNNPPDKSIAVLPFESLSDSKSDMYFADGVQDEILSKLAKVSQLKVISRTSVMAYRSMGNRNLRSIADALGVTHVVEGTVRRNGDRVRITTELIDALTDETLWSDSYDRDLTDIFAIQTDIAQSVSSMLSARLSSQERREIEEKPTNDLDAFDLYLQAKELLSKSSFSRTEESRKDCLGAIRLLEAATQKDSRFAMAYCLMAKAHDELYLDQFDSTPARRALGDAAVKEALRLRPDLPDAHLAAARHFYVCYRDYERARVQIAFAARELPNSPELYALMAYLHRRQGRWEESTAELEKATSLDPINPEILFQLEVTYQYLRRYQDCERLFNRLIKLEPDKPILKIMKASVEVESKANLVGYRTALAMLPASTSDDANLASWRFDAAVLARDWTSAEETLRTSANEEFCFFNGWGKVPRECLEIWLGLLKGDRPTMETETARARDQLDQKVKAHPEDALLLSALGLIDAALGRKQDAIQEARRAVEMEPISKDAMTGPLLVVNLAVVYVRTNEPDLAFQELAKSAKTPGGVTYGELKLNPAWDPIRNDPRFDELLAGLAPHE
jgi:serine/threonine protein kinase/tetratricopeptide (TPR) repeat protein